MGKITEILALFFKLGVFAFGGPAAHIALMQNEVVEKRNWMSQQHFLDLIGITSLVPGPNSTEMVMHCGKTRGGFLGLFVAGIAFILPAVVITLILAMIYKQYAHLPQVEPFIYGIKAAMIALIISAIIKLGKKAIKSWLLGAIATICLVLGFLGLNEIIVILIGGILSLGIAKSNLFASFITPLLFIAPKLDPDRLQLTNPKLFFIFLKIGSILFGSGYLLFAYLETEFIQNLGWLTYDQLAEGIAIGNITPGPVLSTATYIGYELNGGIGAVLATVGIFLPSFLIIVLISPFIEKLQKSGNARLFINGINVAALAMMMVVTFSLGKELLVNWQGITVFLIALTAIIFIKKINSFVFVGGASLLGFLLTLIG